MDNASTNNYGFFSFHSTGEFGRGYYRNHCGPTAISNMMITALQLRRGARLPDDEVQAVFEDVAQTGRRRLIYNRRYGTTDFLLWFYARAAFNRHGITELRPVMRHTLSAKNARRALSRGSFLLLELFGHPKYKWHQMVVYGTDEKGRFVAADGFESVPVYLDDVSIGRGLFLEVRYEPGYSS